MEELKQNMLKNILIFSEKHLSQQGLFTKNTRLELSSFILLSHIPLVTIQQNKELEKICCHNYPYLSM